MFYTIVGLPTCKCISGSQESRITSKKEGTTSKSFVVRHCSGRRWRNENGTEQRKKRVDKLKGQLVLYAVGSVWVRTFLDETARPAFLFSLSESLA